MRHIPFFLFLLVIACQPVSREKEISSKREATIFQIILLSDSLRPHLVPLEEPRRYYNFTSFEHSDSLGSDPSDIELKRIVAELANDTKKLNEIILSFSEINHFVKDSIFLKKLATLYEEQKDRDLYAYLLSCHVRSNPSASLEWINKAILGNPYVEQYYIQKSYLLFSELHKPLEAHLELEKILVFTKEPWTYHYRSCMMYRMANKNKKALSSLEKTIASLETHLKNPLVSVDTSEFRALEMAELMRDLEGYKKEKEELVQVNSSLKTVDK